MGPRRVVWLASLDSLRIDGKRINVTRETESATTLRTSGIVDVQGGVDDKLEAHNDPGALVFGLCEVELVSCFDRMSPRGEDIAAQLQSWRFILGEDLHGSAYVFRVHRMAALDRPQAMQHLGTVRFRGLACQLEGGQSRHLCNLFASGRPAWLPDPPPSETLRAPRPFCEAVANQQWYSLLLPHFPWRARGGASGVVISFRTLLITPGEVPQLTSRRATSESSGTASLTSAMVARIGDALRAHASALDSQSEEGQVQFEALEECVAVLDTVEQELDPITFLKSIRELDGKAGSALSEHGRNIQYKVSFIVKAMMMADMLRSSDNLADAIAQGVGILLPPSLRQPFTELLDNARTVFPTKPTISRWRALIDGAFMLHCRRDSLQSSLSEGGVSYLMADSSMQHGRDFEHIILKRVAADKLPQLLQCSLDLCDLWPLSPAARSSASAVVLDLENI